MPKPKINLYVDIVSPFSYLAYYMSRHSPIFSSTNVTVTYTPIFLGGLMKSCDNRPPLEIRNKDRWIGVERLRWARQFDIPITETPPRGFPVLTLHVQRALCALELAAAGGGGGGSGEGEQTALVKALDALYHSMWVEGDGGVGKPDGFGPVLERAIGEELGRRAVVEGSGKEAKERLMANTDQAFKAGAFGLPWWECTDSEGKTEGFWGFDHLGQVVRFLGLDGKLDLERSAKDGMRSVL